MSSYASVRLGGILVTCLLGSLLTFSAYAQTSAPMLSAVTFNTLPALQASTPIPGSTHVPGDFNKDGTSDLLWFNPNLSQLSYWTMATISPNSFTTTANSVRVVETSNTFAVTPGYFVGAVGDFNNDGYADLVFTSANNDLWLWTNNQNGGFTSTKIGTYPANWQLVGAGDVDGDGYDDLLWMDAADCQFGYWTMHGSTRTGGNIIPVPCGYYPIAVGYFSSSNRISIMWTSPANDLIVWDSTGSSFTSYDVSSSSVVFSYMNFQHWFSLGGGYMGSNIGVESYLSEGDVQGTSLTRTFDNANNQTGFSWSAAGGGLVGEPGLFSAGFLVEGNGINQTALYVFDASELALSTSGLGPGANVPPVGANNLTVNGMFVASGVAGTAWIFPIGWSVVGSPSNVMNTIPWQTQ